MSLSSFAWSVADLLHGDYKQSEYGKVVLPFTVLRMLRMPSRQGKQHGYEPAPLP
jgi:type I restriction-modification system DNA methylase subunit